MARPEPVTLHLAGKEGALVLQVKNKNGVVGEVILKGMTAGEFKLDVNNATAIISKTSPKHGKAPGNQKEEVPPSAPVSVQVETEVEPETPEDDFRPPAQEGESRAPRKYKRSDK